MRNPKKLQSCISLLALLAVALLLGPIACGGAESTTDTAETDAEAPDIDIAGINEPRGLRRSEPGAQPGYTLFGPILSDTTYLIDNDGLVVHTWQFDYAPSGGIYLLDNGNLIRPAREPGVERFPGGGQGGRIQEFTWDGELVWDFEFASDQHLTQRLRIGIGFENADPLLQQHRVGGALCEPRVEVRDGLVGGS